MTLLRILVLITGAFLASAHGAEPLRIVTLSSVLTELAREIGGTEVQVIGLLRGDTDPHTFNPTPADVRTLAAADLVLANGLHFETYLRRLTANSGTRAEIVEAASALGDAAIEVEHHGHREPDPHWWHSTAMTKRVAVKVARALAERRPAAATQFSARADAVVAKLDELDAWARREIAPLPLERRRLVTTHDAFGYFARDFGFTVHAISGLSTEAEPNARDLARLVDRVRREKILAIFIENTENARLPQALVRETGAKLGGKLYADGLSAAGDGATYEGMFRHNVRTIVAALK